MSPLDLRDRVDQTIAASHFGKRLPLRRFPIHQRSYLGFPIGMDHHLTIMRLSLSQGWHQVLRYRDHCHDHADQVEPNLHHARDKQGYALCRFGKILCGVHL